jgi:hypothetical protein
LSSHFFTVSLLKASLKLGNSTCILLIVRKAKLKYMSYARA